MKQVIIIRKDLNIRKGKCVAQGAPNRSKPNLTWDKVNEIRNLLIKRKLTQAEIGNLFLVPQTIGLIKNNKIWRINISDTWATKVEYLNILHLY